MKKIGYLLIFMSLFIQVVGCRKIEPINEPVSKSNKSAVVWKLEREYKGLASNNYIINGIYIQGISSNGRCQVVAVDLNSNKEIWRVKDFPGGFDAFNVDESLVKNNIFILSDKQSIIAIDIEIGKIIWQDYLSQASGSIACIDDVVYKVSTSSTNSILFGYNIFSGEKAEIFGISKFSEGEGIFEPDLSMAVKWKDINGNELLILSSRGWNGQNGLYRMDIMAWNITADSMEWYRKGLDERGSLTTPIIDDNRVYFYSIFKLHCIDANTGETIWDWETDPRDNFGGFKTANMLMVGNKMIVKPDSYWMYALDKMTGQRIWVNENTSPMPYLLREHQDTIWFSSGGIYAIDANTGSKLIDGWDDANPTGFWGNAIIHHPTNGYIYTTDGDYIYCLNPRYMN